MLCPVAGGLQEAMVEQYNDQLRELREHDMTDVSEAFRQTVRELRDEERTPPGAVQVYGLMRTVSLIVFSSRNLPFTLSAALEKDEMCHSSPGRHPGRLLRMVLNASCLCGHVASHDDI